MLCSTLLLFCFLSSSKVDAWGGLFNRFNPSMLSDLGYGGGSYGKELYSAAHSGVGRLISLFFSVSNFAILYKPHENIIIYPYDLCCNIGCIKYS